MSVKKGLLILPWQSGPASPWKLSLEVQHHCSQEGALCCWNRLSPSHCPRSTPLPALHPARPGPPPPCSTASPHYLLSSWAGLPRGPCFPQLPFLTGLAWVPLGESKSTQRGKRESASCQGELTYAHTHTCTAVCTHAQTHILGPHTWDREGERPPPPATLTREDPQEQPLDPHAIFPAQGGQRGAQACTAPYPYCSPLPAPLSHYLGATPASEANSPLERKKLLMGLRGLEEAEGGQRKRCRELHLSVGCSWGKGKGKRSCVPHPRVQCAQSLLLCRGWKGPHNGTGVLDLCRAGSASPTFTCRSCPYEVAGPVTVPTSMGDVC